MQNERSFNARFANMNIRLREKGTNKIYSLSGSNISMDENSIYCDNIWNSQIELVLDKLVKNPDWQPTEGSLPVFTNTLKDGGLTISKFTTSSDSADPDQKFKFKVKLIGEKIEDGAVSWSYEEAPGRIVTLTYDANGGYFGEDTSRVENILTYKEASGTAFLQSGEYLEPTKAGSTFDGFYEDEELTIRWHPSDIPTENKRVYAKWN